MVNDVNDLIEKNKLLEEENHKLREEIMLLKDKVNKKPLTSTERQKRYYEKNKEKAKERQKKYMESNKEKVKEWNHVSYLKKKNKLKEQIKE
jgi:hypothetical protein